MRGATDFNKLPLEVQEKVKDTLKAYHRVEVTYEYGEYHVDTGTMLKASYGDDFKVLGEYKDVDVFTPDEMIINYAEEFLEYPVQYKGKRDYRWINSLEYGCKLKLDDQGNLVEA